MTVLGYWTIVFALIASALSLYNYYRTATTKTIATARARRFVKLSAASIVLASAFLLTLLLQHDFSNGYVYSYSSRSLPLHFLISSFYAGQEGSFLFWALCSAVISVFLMRFTGKRNSEPWVMAVFMGAQAFLLLLLTVKTPFQYVWEMFPQAAVNQIPADGRGLNPLLQNFWMVAHPPVLFIGFAAMAVPFSFAVGALWKKQFSLMSEQTFPWLLGASLVLGLGIMLGAYWAYGILGWGGYWGWDPVENSSLIPWLTSVALIHTMLAERKTKKFIRTNFALAIASFLLVVYSTFLTRSGILGDSSVHSFVDPGATVYWLLVAFLLAIAGTGFGLMYRRRADLRPDARDPRLLTRESFLGAGALVVILSAVVILFGTSLPITGTTTVEPAFYDATNLPIAIAIGLLIGFSLFTQWGIDDWVHTIKRSARSLVVSVAFIAVLYYAGVHDWAMLLFALSSAFAFVVNLEIVLKTPKVNIRLLGGKLAHIGLGIFFLGVISTGKYSTTQHLALQLNTPQETLGHTLTYVGYEPTHDGKFAFNIRIEKDGEGFTLAPIMFDAGQQGIMRNPDIASSFMRDFYVSPVSLERPTAHADHETYTIPKGESVSIGGITARFVRFDMDQHGTDPMTSRDDGMAIGSVLELSNGASRETITPIAVYPTDGTPRFETSRSKLMNANVQLVSMNVGMGSGKSTVTVKVDRHDGAPHQPEALVVEASIKPFTNLLWAGTFIMMAGFVLAMVKRFKEA